MTNLVRSEEPAVYGPLQACDEDDLIAKALAVLSRRVRDVPLMDNPRVVRDYLRLKSAGLDYEVFGVMFLDCHVGLINYEQMFRGTLMETRAYPREIVKTALKLGAAGVILHHNHPSGDTTPSRADEALTQHLKTALSLVDVRVHDHIITSDRGSTSMAERGLM